MEQLTPEQITALQQSHSTLQAAYSALESDHLKALEKIEALEKENYGLQDGNKKLMAGIAQGEEVIEKLQAKLSVAENAAPAEENKSLPSFKFEDEEYEVIIPRVNIPRIGIRTAKEITQDPEAQKFLVKFPGNIGTVIRKK